MSQEQDRAFFRNYAIVIGLIGVAMVLFMVLGNIIGTDDEADAERRASAVAERTAPVGEVAVEGEADAAGDESVAASGGKSGEEVYNSMCVACHSVPGIGAPVVGTESDWTARLEKGMGMMYENAINGFTGPEGFMMPARGGGSFSDEEVKAAVDYMVVNSGGDVPAATETAAAAPAGKSGEEVYNAMCVACHSVAAIAPATGDAAEWAPRIEQGMDKLYDNAINGFTGSKGMMPPRGGGSFTDDEVKAAVDYMVEKSK